MQKETIIAEFATALGHHSLTLDDQGYVALTSDALDITLIVGLQERGPHTQATLECDFLSGHTLGLEELNDLLNQLWQYTTGLALNDQKRYLLRETLTLPEADPTQLLLEKTEDLVQLALQLRDSLRTKAFEPTTPTSAQHAYLQSSQPRILG